MNKHVPLICFLFLLGCATTTTYGKPDGDLTVSPGFPGEVGFTVGGATLDGELYQLRGVNAVDPLAQAYWNLPGEVGPFERSYYEEIKRMGSRIVRIPLHPDSWRDNQPDALNVVRQAVDWCGELGMYVIVEFHSIGMLHTGVYEASQYDTDKAEFRAFWNVISAEFKDDEHIAAYGLFNEPVNLQTEGTAADWMTWKQDAEEAIDLIRANDPGRPVLVGGLHWSYDLTHAVLKPIDREKVVYDAHIYPFTPDFMSWEDAVGQAADVLPVFVGEWGWDVVGLYDETSYGPAGTYGPAVAAFMDEHNLGWTAWSFSANWDPRMLADWDYNLTEYGAFAKDLLQSQ